jgi:hypothetical protein
VASPTRLAGLAGETRQRLRRRRDTRGRKAREKTGPDSGEPELPRLKSKLTAAAPHHWSSKLAYVRNSWKELRQSHQNKRLMRYAVGIALYDGRFF